MVQRTILVMLRRRFKEPKLLDVSPALYFMEELLDMKVTGHKVEVVTNHSETCSVLIRCQSELVPLLCVSKAVVCFMDIDAVDTATFSSNFN